MLHIIVVVCTFLLTCIHAVHCLSSIQIYSNVNVPTQCNIDNLFMLFPGTEKAMWRSILQQENSRLSPTPTGSDST